MFGPTVTNSDGKLIAIRSIGEDHVLEDLGQIPTLEDWLHYIPMDAARSMNLNNVTQSPPLPQVPHEDKQDENTPAPTNILELPKLPDFPGDYQPRRRGGGWNDMVVD